MKIVIADDHTLFAEGLKHLLESRGHQVIGSAKDGIEACEMAQKLQPDLMLVDISMPKCDGLEAAAFISAQYEAIKIVILTSSENESDIFNAVKAGACGYFAKSFQSKELFELLDALENEETPVSPGLAGKILNELACGKSASYGADRLTERQRHVLSLVAQGMIYKEIADKLSISERTVKYHVKTVIDKLHLQNRNQLIDFAARANILHQY